MCRCCNGCWMRVYSASACTFPWLPFPLSNKEWGRGGGLPFPVCLQAFTSCWKLGTSGSKCDVCACLSQTSAPNSMTPVSIMGTSLSSTCTSRMVLSIWERLAGSRLQGTHRWITYRGRERRQLCERKHPIKFMELCCLVSRSQRVLQGKIGHKHKQDNHSKIIFTV